MIFEAQRWRIKNHSTCSAAFGVLDITQFIAGPTATRFLAQMGAEVIKIEIAPIGDRARALPLLKDGRSSHFVQHNLGKKSFAWI